MKKFLLVCAVILFAKGSVAYSQEVNFDSLVAISYNSSPFLKTNKSKQELTDNYKELVNSYYFPVIYFKEEIISTNNPMYSFGGKLTQEKLQANDFASIDKLNNPDRNEIYKSSAGVYLPIDISNSISQKKNVVEKEKESLIFEEKWIKKELEKNLYSLYFANINLVELAIFLKSEKNFLEKIINIYDTKSDENKNRYLSYNQARIILENINEGLNVIEVEKEKILNNVKYISGIDSLVLSTALPREIIVNSDVDNFKRYDLDSMGKVVESKEMNVRLKQKAYLPSLNLFGEYSKTSDSLLKNEGKDNTVGLQFVWNFGLSINKDVSVARAEQNVAKEQYQSKLREVNTEIKNQKKELDRLKIQIESMEKKHQLFTENKKILSYQYQRGSVDLYNLLDNFVNYIQNYSDLQRVKSEYRAKLISYAINF